MMLGRAFIARTALLVAILGQGGCRPADRVRATSPSTPARPTVSVSPARPAPAVSDLLGTWTVIGHHMPGVSAMSDAEARRWHGRTIRLAADEAISDASRCDAPAYTERTVAWDSVRRDFGLAPGALPTLASAERLRVLEVSCGGALWGAAGARLFASGGNRAVTLWDGVFFELARARDFRAVGQEPGWSLDIESSKAMRFSYDYGARTVATPVPPVEAGRGGARTYHAVSGANDLRVVIDSVRCTDAMSGREFEATVTVTLNGRTFRGCGEERRSL